MKWQRPKTTRMYIHPPMAESMFTLWREGRIMYGEVELALRNEYFDLVSRAIWPVYADNKSSDFKTAEYLVREDGIPVHGMKNSFGELSVECECFTTYEKRPTLFAKYTLKNNTDRTVSERFGFLVRTAKEHELISGAPDLYCIYTAEVDEWLKLPSTFVSRGGVLSDGEYYITLSDSDFSFDEKAGAAMKLFTLNSGEETSFTLAFGSGDVIDYDYEAEKEGCIKRWQSELSRINKLPEAIENNPRVKKLILNLTVQMLQCFALPRGSDYVFSRQGGLQRQVWIYETMPVLKALNRIGEFKDYIEPVIDTYFSKFQNEEGEVQAFGIPWAMLTACSITSFAEYAINAGREYYLKYRDAVMRAFGWMKRTRATTVDSEDEVGGIFPPLRSCDDELIFQGWTATDPHNVIALRELTRVARYYNDGMADDIESEYLDYLGVMRRAWGGVVAAAGDSDEIKVPIALRNNEEAERKFAFNPGTAFMVEAIDMDEEDAERVINYYTRRDVYRGGLYDKMPNERPEGTMERYKFFYNDEGVSYVWYVASHEYHWFNYFMKHNRRDKAEEIIKYNENYATTDELYMLERYHCENPWFAPWSPNESANGRTVNMLLDFYG